MGNFILVRLLTIIFYVGILFLSRPKCKEEDKHQSNFGNLKIRKTETVTTLISYGLMILLMLDIIIFLSAGDVSIYMLVLIWVLLLLFCFYALYYRNDYYMIDDERISYVESGKVEWSLRWDEIDRVHKRFEEVEWGLFDRKDYYETLYDIQKKDGERIPDLPSTLGRDFEKYVFVDKDEYDKAFRKWWLFVFLSIPIGLLIIFAIIQII